MKMKKFLLLTMVVVAVFVVACAAPTPEKVVEKVTVKETVVVAGTPQVVEKVITATPPPAAPKPKVLRVNGGAFPDIIDPQKSSFVGEIAHLHLIYEGLTRFNEKLETVPAAAEKWEYNKDATQLTFTLRKGLKYSDGSLLNAMRFKYALMRNINPATAGEYATITNEIKGAEAWQSADLTKTSKEELAKLEKAVDASIEALDSTGKPCKTGKDGYAQEDCLTLRLTFAAPAPYFHTIMGIWVVYPAKEENITAGKDIWWTSAKYQIGNGPFVLKSLEPYVRARFEPNPNYWGEKAKIAIEYSYITDSAVSYQAYKNNEFDIVGLAAEDLEATMKDPVLSKEALIYPGSCTFAVMFHQEKEPFTDKKVREAFAYALDREAWVKDVLRGLGSPTLTWIPKGYPGYQEGEKRYGFDPAAAKKALSESKYGSADKLPPITLTFSDTPRNRTRNEWLQKKWKEVLGVDIKLNPVDPTTYTALTKDSKTAPQVYILGWCADYPDPQNWLSVYWKTGAFGERIRYSNKELDKILAEADSTIDPKKRMELYAKAQDMLINDAPVAFMWNNVNSYLVKPWVKGYKVTPQDHWFPGDGNAFTIDIDTALLPK
jgi:oligopeptide transport system substrate-binding protein